MPLGKQSKVNPHIKGLRDAITPDVQDSEYIIWRRILNSLRRIESQLHKWGLEMVRTAVYPDISTICEASAAIDQLYPVLSDLIVWLRTKREDRWLFLRTGIEYILKTVPRRKIGPTFASYMIWRRRQEDSETASVKKPSPREIEQYLKKQFFVGEELIKMANAINQAIKTSTKPNT
jgi:hypothetical protein